MTKVVLVNQKVQKNKVMETTGDFIHMAHFSPLSNLKKNLKIPQYFSAFLLDLKGK
jgi:hypothetical protein